MGSVKKRPLIIDMPRYLDTLDEFNKAIKDGKCVVDFTASWCGPCRYIAPIFEKLEAEYKEKNIKFWKVDVDENEEAAMEAGISAMPTFLFFNKGVKVGEMIGADDEELVEEL